MKFTRKNLNAMLAEINVKLNRPSAPHSGGKWQIGNLHTDYNSSYSGYQLREVANAVGSIKDGPLSLEPGHRLTVRELGRYLDGFLAGLDNKI